MRRAKLSIEEIAKHFDVSENEVEDRIKALDLVTAFE